MSSVTLGSVAEVQQRPRQSSRKRNWRALTLLVGGAGVGITLGVLYREKLYDTGKALLNKIPIAESLKTAISETTKKSMIQMVELGIQYGNYFIVKFLHRVSRSIKPVILGPIRRAERKFYRYFGVQYQKDYHTDDENETPGIDRVIDRKGISPSEILRNYAKRTEIEDEILAGLSQKQGSSVLLLGPPGSGKSSLIAGVASRLKNKQDLHPQLKNVEIVEVKMGEFLKVGNDSFMNKVLVFVKQFENCQDDKIIYIDEFWAIKGQDQLSQFFREELKGLLAKNNNLRLLCCTTLDGYENVDKAFERRFTVINVFEPPEDLLKQMLKSHIEVLEKHHQCNYPDSIIDDVVELTRDIPNSYHPAKAIGVLDAAASWAWVGFKAKADEGSTEPIITREHIERVVNYKKQQAATTQAFLNTTKS